MQEGSDDGLPETQEGAKPITRRGGKAHHRKLASLAYKLEIAEIDVFNLKFTKSLAGYEVEFRGRRFAFDEEQPLAERWIKEVTHEERFRDHIFSNAATWFKVGIGASLQSASSSWQHIASNSEQRVRAADWVEAGATRAGVIGSGIPGYQAREAPDIYRPNRSLILEPGVDIEPSLAPRNRTVDYRHFRNREWLEISRTDIHRFRIGVDVHHVTDLDLHRLDPDVSDRTKEAFYRLFEAGSIPWILSFIGFDSQDLADGAEVKRQYICEYLKFHINKPRQPEDELLYLKIVHKKQWNNYTQCGGKAIELVNRHWTSCST